MAKAVLVTGAEGFVGRNLCVTLSLIPGLTVLKYDVRNSENELAGFVKAADFVFHLAGVNRPEDPEEFKTGNVGFTEHLLSLLRVSGRKIPVLISSSTQAAMDNPYGASKHMAEEAVFAYGREVGVEVYVYRLPNVFGKWCRPNYNSAVATWCHNIANGLPIQVRDPDASLTLVYVDDVVDAFISELGGESLTQRHGDGEDVITYRSVPVIYTKKLGEITAQIENFKKSRSTLQVADQSDGFTKKLYATYLSYLPDDQFSYPLKMNTDTRGSFTEILKTPERGQVSVNVSKPGIVKGNHWHHTKNEKFLVVSGKGVIRFRKIGALLRGGAGGAKGPEITEYHVSGEKLEVVEIPPGYTHNIENVGDTDMVTVIWASESFDPDKPDTFFEKV